MKMYLISDNVDTLTGMRLAGVEGVVVHEKHELVNALDFVIKSKDIGIVLLTEKFSKDYPELVNKYKMESHIPLFIDIPDRHGTGRSENFITDYVNEAIGLKL
jgi:ATP synthase, subunit F